MRANKTTDTMTHTANEALVARNQSPEVTVHQTKLSATDSTIVPLSGQHAVPCRQAALREIAVACRRRMAAKLALTLMAGVIALVAPLPAQSGAYGHDGLPGIPRAAAAAAVTHKLVKKSETIVSAGVKQLTYVWVPSSSSKSTETMHVIEVDLTNPYVTLNAMGGKNGSVTARQSVAAMAKETGAIAGVNGDVFNTTGDGAPIGAQITSGRLLVSTSRLNGLYAFAVTKDRKPLIDNFSFEGTVTVHKAGAVPDASVRFPLAGVNKSLYWAEPDKANSHVNALYLYTSEWTAAERPANTGTRPTEALVAANGIVQEISIDKHIATPVPAGGYILRGHGTAARFMTDHLTVGSAVNADYRLKSLATGRTYAPSDFQMMVSGHTILLDQGKAAAFSRDINGVSGYAARARTAVGYSKDGTMAYLVTVEETGNRKGVTLAELQQMLLQLGVWKAVNLDGGGSTTMAARPLGGTAIALSHPTTYGGATQRLVSNGIGVYTNAPRGAVKGVVASGPQTLLIGQEATYALQGYDTYYNPITPSADEATWSASDSRVAVFTGSKLTARKPGKTVISVQAGLAASKLEVEVVGQDRIERLTVEPSTTLLQPGAVIAVPVKAQLKDGRELPVPASAIQWEFRGFTATAQDGMLTIGAVQPDAQTGFAIARYDGFGTAAMLTPGTERPLETFEQPSYAIDFSGLPAQTSGSATLTEGFPGRESSQALSLAYDFTGGTGSRFAYAVLNPAGGGIDVPGEPSFLTLDMLGDAGMNYARAEFTDRDGAKALVDVARRIDWSGWKPIRIDLAAAGVKGPAKLTKLYVVNLEQDQDKRAMQGEVAYDNLMLQYPPKPYTPMKPTIVMHTGQTAATIDGKPVKLPAAPFLLNDIHYLPLRFITETLGADIEWDGTAKRVTVLRGDTMLELWIGRAEVVVNGAREPVIAAPILRNNSTYVPVRVVSEQWGQTVGWKGETKTITIR